MDIQTLFLQAFIYLCAALVAILLGKRLGVGAVLGYLLVGILIGPWGLGLIGEQNQDVMHFAEFGVVMMLFLIGLELQPSMLWSMRRKILGLGGLQVVLHRDGNRRSGDGSWPRMAARAGGGADPFTF
ncbi:MAG: cation:proton antiporter [Verrucomicrobia bacterium]|jgi:Kef-type K+ transport system membrane component KefB|nr:cation:proton antiporter [Verrucomicrobiota bacterium]|tara:strand:- start:3631 stop:4014 length:384 start_codon:yes stop_codon:yes gene_type:complete